MIRLNQYCIFTCLILISVFSFGEESNSGITPANNTSSENRNNKNFSFTTDLIGSGPFAFPIPYSYSEGSRQNKSSLNFSYFLNNNNLINIEYRSLNLTPDLNSGGHSLSAYSLGFFYKHFLSSSFYYLTGFDSINFDYQYSVASGALSPYVDKFKGQTINIEFTIGNQWQWDNFTLGCDWIGVSEPIYAQFKSESLNPVMSQNTLKDDENLFFKNGTINLLRFYIGISF